MKRAVIFTLLVLAPLAAGAGTLTCACPSGSWSTVSGTLSELGISCPSVTSTLRSNLASYAGSFCNDDCNHQICTGSFTTVYPSCTTDESGRTVQSGTLQYKCLKLTCLQPPCPL